MVDCDLKILNGLGGEKAEFTYAFMDRRSTIGFVITGSRSVNVFESCNTGDEINSTHFPLVAYFKEILPISDFTDKVVRQRKVTLDVDLEVFLSFLEIYDDDANIDNFVDFCNDFVQVEVIRVQEPRNVPRLVHESRKVKSTRSEARSLLKQFRRDGSRTTQLAFWIKRMEWYKALRQWKLKQDEYFRNKFDACLKDRSNQSKQLWRMLKGNSVRISETVISISSWLAHFSRLLYVPNARKFKFLPRGLSSVILDPEIEISEIGDRLHERSLGKRGGPDNLNVAFWKMAWANSEVRLWVKMNFQKFLNGCEFPRSWNEGEIALLFKNKGAMSDPNNWRGISLTNELLKLFESILAHRLSQWAEKNLELFSQSAFRKSYSVLEHTVTLECMIRDACDGRKLYVALMDLCKAFPSIDRCLLLEKLQNLGLSDKFMKCLTNLYTDMIIFI